MTKKELELALERATDMLDILIKVISIQEEFIYKNESTEHSIIDIMEYCQEIGVEKRNEICDEISEIILTNIEMHHKED